MLNVELSGGFNGNYGVGSIGEKWGIVGEGCINYGISNGMGLGFRGGGGVYMSSSGWGMFSEGGGMRGCGYMNNIEVIIKIDFCFW